MQTYCWPKSQEHNVISKYEVIAQRADISGALGPLEFEMERNSILIDFEVLAVTQIDSLPILTGVL